MESVGGFKMGRKELDKAVVKLKHLKDVLRRAQDWGCCISEVVLNEANRIQEMLDEDWCGETFVQRYASCHEICMRMPLLCARRPRMLVGMGVGVGVGALGIAGCHLPASVGHLIGSLLYRLSLAGGGGLILVDGGQQVTEWCRLHKKRIEISLKVEELNEMVHLEFQLHELMNRSSSCTVS